MEKKSVIKNIHTCNHIITFHLLAAQQLSLFFSFCFFHVAADAMVHTGLASLGYEYINIGKILY